MNVPRRSIVAVLSWAALAPHPAGAQPASPSGPTAAQALRAMPSLNRTPLLPAVRAGTTSRVSDDERNPFGLLSIPQVDEEEPVPVKVESEEQKIKRVLANMRVGGLRMSAGSYRVLLGNMSLSKGDRLPQIFANQVEQLVVDDVEAGKIYFRFVENAKNTSPPRTFSISFNRGLSMANEDGTPRVRSLMAGDLYLEVVKFEEGEVVMQPIPTAPAQGLLDAFSNEQLHEALYSGRRQLLGETWRLKEDENANTQQEEE